MKRSLPFGLLIALLLAVPAALAHCPLCTIGAAAAAGGAMWLGVSTIVVGLFIGAFAASTGWWMSNLVKRQFVPRQKQVIIVLSFVLTIIPMMAVIKDFIPVSILWWGDYGSFLNRTYLLNSFLLGSIGGLGIMFITPWMSATITRWRQGKMIPYQGIMLTLGLLVATGTAIQIFV